MVQHKITTEMRRLKVEPEGRLARLLPHFGDEDLLRDLPAAADLQQRKLIGEVARRDLAFELDEGHLGADEIDRQDMIFARETLQLR